MVFEKMRSQTHRPGWRARGVRVLLLGAFLLARERAAAAAEPGLAAVQRAALVRAGLSEGATTRLLARHHLAALLPQVRVTLGRGWQLSATGRALDGLTEPVVDGDHTSYAVSASWDLARLLVPREALQLHHAAPRLAQQRLAVMAQVAGLVGARCRLLQLAGPQASSGEQVAELEAALALLTGDHPLPEVTPETRCPAVPRFKVAGTRRLAGSHRPSALPHRAAPDDGGDDGDDDRLAAPLADGPEYDYE